MLITLLTYNHSAFSKNPHHKKEKLLSKQVANITPSNVLKPSTEDLSIETRPPKFKQNILYDNALIGSAIYQDQEDGGRRILVSLDAEYENKNIEPYLEELLQRKVNQTNLRNLKSAIREIDYNKLTLGNRLVASGSMHLLKAGSDIMSINYSDEQEQENGPITREPGTVITNEESRGQGYGSYLMERFIEKSRKDNISKISLESTPNAIKFYERLGFIRQGNTKIMILNLK